MDIVPPPTEVPDTVSYRLKRNAEEFIERWRGWWQSKRFRLATYAVGGLVVLVAHHHAYGSTKGDASLCS